MLLNVGQYAIGRLDHNIEALEKRAYDLHEGYTKQYKLGDNDMMARTNRKLVYVEFLIQALEDSRKQQEELNERIRQDPGLDEEYEQSDFPELRDDDGIEATEQVQCSFCCHL